MGHHALCGSPIVACEILTPFRVFSSPTLHPSHRFLYSLLIRAFPTRSAMTLLPKTHRIVERPLMEFRPFGRNHHGATIQDVSGITVRANVEYLETLMTRKYGAEAVQATLEKLVWLLNERISDRTYHVTVDFLKNTWNSYSYEFVMFLTEFSIQLSEQPDYHFNMGREKFLSPIVQILGRPFSIVQIYRLFPYFVEKFAKGSLKPEVVSVTNGHAVMRMQFSESALAQFGPYLRGCAERVCHTTKATISQVPASMFGQQPATIEDTCCIAEGDPYCEWVFRWSPQTSPLWIWIFAGAGLSLVMLGLTMTLSPHYPWWGHAGLSLLPLFIMPLTGRVWTDRKELQERGAIIQEQLASAEQQHEELRRAYLQQEQSLIEVRRHNDEIEALNLGLETKVQERTTELQQANLDLETANTRLKDLDRMKSQFLSHCSHELRTPLTSIKGFTENMLHGMVGPLAERQHLYLTRISANANRLTRMIGDLLDLSRIEAGTVRLAHQSVSLPSLLDDITQEFMPLTQPKNQELVLETTGEDVTIWGDPDRLHQIVTNLVHNAHKFTPEHGRIVVAASADPPNHILLSITDSGPGIPQEALAHLFQAFYQAHRRPEIGTEGLGLGLSIVKQLVELHGATITVESTVGAGTTFCIRFPKDTSTPASTSV
jgi:signal transduction histidine kinase